MYPGIGDDDDNVDDDDDDDDHDDDHDDDDDDDDDDDNPIRLGTWSSSISSLLSSYPASVTWVEVSRHPHRHRYHRHCRHRHHNHHDFKSANEQQNLAYKCET